MLRSKGNQNDPLDYMNERIEANLGIKLKVVVDSEVTCNLAKVNFVKKSV